MKRNLLHKRFIQLLFVTTLFFCSFVAEAQQGSLKGKISDRNGEPLVGATVVVNATTVGTVSDINGNYTLEKVPSGEILVNTSFVGYFTKSTKIKVEAGKVATMNVTLEEDNQNLADVVVIGYGTQKKSDLTGAVSSVKTEELMKIPSGNLEGTLQGKVAGVSINQTTGAPGAGTTVRIRGISSFNGGQPLWVVDGIPSSPNAVSPTDIESIEILKDASTAAIYGSAGANGVVLITTKKGTKGKLDVNFNAYYGVQQVGRTMDMADAKEAGNYINEAELILGKRPSRMYFSDYHAIDTLTNYDHQSDLFRSAAIQNYGLSVAGGSDKSNYYFGLGYFNQDGIVYNTNFDRLNLKLNSEFKVRDWFSIGELVTFSTSENSGFAQWKLLSEYESPIMHAALFSPFQPTRDANGNYLSDRAGIYNPQATLDHVANENSINYSGSATVFAKITPMKGLTFETRYTSGIGFNEYRAFADVYQVPGSTQKNDKMSITRNYNKSIGWKLQNLLSYNTTIANKINLSAMVGQESGYGYNHGMSGVRYDMINSSPEMWYFDASTDNASLAQIVRGTADESAGYSYLGRLSVDYKGRYLAQFNFRQDASSVFGPENRTGSFPSFSAGWKFSEEEFMKNLTWLDFGKIRYGWGQAGNNAVPNYEFYSTVLVNEIFDYSFNNGDNILVGAAPGKLVNRAIHWETITTTNLGLDLSMFKNRLSLTADYFTRENEEMLMQVSVPNMAGWWVFDSYHEGGAANANSNVGKLRNSGVEVTAGWKESVGAKFSYDVDLNFTYIKNEAIDLKGDSILNGQCRGVSGYLTNTYTGSGVGSFFGREVEKIFQQTDGFYDEATKRWTMTNQPFVTNETTGEKVYAQPNAQPGDYQWKDINGDGKIDNNDKTFIGNPHPKYLMGMNMNFSYGIFDLSMFWQSALDFQIFNGVNAYLLGTSTDGSKNLPATYVNDHYRDDVSAKDGTLLYPANYNAQWARYDPKNQNQNFDTFSSAYIEDGDYLRLKNLQIGVMLPERLTKATTLEDVRFYFGVKNLLTWTKYSGMDPELDAGNPLASGIDKAVYPSARTFTFGVNLKF